MFFMSFLMQAFSFAVALLLPLGVIALVVMLVRMRREVTEIRQEVRYLVAREHTRSVEERAVAPAAERTL